MLCLFPRPLLLSHRLDETAEHFLLRLLPSLQPIGTVRASRASCGGAPYYKLSRLAVLKDFRKHSLGRELVLALHNVPFGLVTLMVWLSEIGDASWR